MKALLCYIRHDWLGWSAPVAIGTKIMQARSCRRCNSMITRRVIDSEQFFAEINAGVPSGVLQHGKDGSR